MSFILFIILNYDVVIIYSYYLINKKTLWVFNRKANAFKITSKYISTFSTSCLPTHSIYYNPFNITYKGVIYEYLNEQKTYLTRLIRPFLLILRITNNFWWLLWDLTMRAQVSCRNVFFSFKLFNLELSFVDRLVLQGIPPLHHVDWLFCAISPRGLLMFPFVPL